VARADVEPDPGPAERELEPSRSGASKIGTPSIAVPLRLPRSRTEVAPSAIRISQWNFDIVGSSITKSACGSAPITVRSRANAWVVPSVGPPTIVSLHSRTDARIGAVAVTGWVARARLSSSSSEG